MENRSPEERVTGASLSCPESPDVIAKESCILNAYEYIGWETTRISQSNIEMIESGESMSEHKWFM
jgi:hypothetical protein